MAPRSWVIALVAVAVGCASVPAPREEVAQAESALREAEEARAAEHAPVEMRMAREKLERARDEIDAGENGNALTEAEQAEVDARVALAKARHERAKEASDEMRDTLRALEEEILHGTDNSTH